MPRDALPRIFPRILMNGYDLIFFFCVFPFLRSNFVIRYVLLVSSIKINIANVLLTSVLIILTIVIWFFFFNLLLKSKVLQILFLIFTFKYKFLLMIQLLLILQKVKCKIT